MNIATVFSGIGAPEFALKTYFYQYVNPKIVFACDCGEANPLSEQDVTAIKSIASPKERQQLVKKMYLKLRKRHWVKETYFANYSSMGISEDSWHDDIRFIDGNCYKGKVDLFIGGSPCQSFSNMGHRKGLEDARGTLFYDYARLIKEIEPKVFIYENVPGMLNHDFGQTWETIKGVFKSLGYDFSFKVLNSVDYGIPQNRKRLFVVGFKEKQFSKRFCFPEPIPLICKASSFLDKDVDPKYYLGEKGFKFVTTHKGRARINMNIIRTEKRNQQFNWNGDFVFVPLEEIEGNPKIMNKAFVGLFEGKEGVARKMTPRECHRLMGFKDDFVICQNDVEAYKQAGNSIVVDVMKNLFDSIFKTGVFYEKN